jgi:hypothetical protein
MNSLAKIHSLSPSQSQNINQLQLTSLLIYLSPLMGICPILQPSLLMYLSLDLQMHHILQNAKLIQLPITNSLKKPVNAHARSVVVKIVQGVQAENTAKVFAKIVAKWNAVDVTVSTLKRNVLLDGISTTRH